MAGFSLPATITGSNLAGATAVTFSGGGVTAVIGPGATDTSVPVVISVSSGAAPGVRDVTVTTTSASSGPFNGYTVVPLSPSGMIVTFAGDGTTVFKGDAGPAILAGLDEPGFVAVDAGGNVYIADRVHNRIRKVAPDGIIDTYGGNGSPGFSGDGGSATLASISNPADVLVDSSGNLLIADYANNRIRKVATNGTITTIAGNGNAGFGGDSGPATLAQINLPRGLAMDAAGNLFIADTSNHRVRKVSTNGTITTVAGNGFSGFSGDNGPATSASLTFPSGLAVDPAGNLFIADTANQRIRKVAPNGNITTIAGTGFEQFSGDGGPAVSAGLRNPSGVTIDPNGNVVITDAGSGRIRRIDAAGIINTIAGNGTLFGFSGDGGPATGAAMGPLDVAIDSTGNLFIADHGNDRVRKVTLSPPGRRVRGQVTSQ
jgi:sugar lactone lactonase YvrE